MKHFDLNISTKDFFNLLFEDKHRFEIERKKIKEGIDNKIRYEVETDDGILIKEMVFTAPWIFSYGGFSSAEHFDLVFRNKSRSILFKINNQYLNNEIAEGIIQNYLKRIKETFELFETVQDGNETYFSLKQVRIYFEEGFSTMTDFRELEKMGGLHFALFEFSQVLYQTLEYLEDGFKNIIESKPVSYSGISKLQTNLSVSDISLLFRLLDDEGLFNYRHKTEVYRFVSNYFCTVNQDNISEASVKNKYLSPDNSSTKNLDILLTNLRQRLRKIQ